MDRGSEEAFDFFRAELKKDVNSVLEIVSVIISSSLSNFGSIVVDFPLDCPSLIVGSLLLFFCQIVLVQRRKDIEEYEFPH